MNFTHFCVSQGSVATQLRCGGMFSNHFTTNFSQNAQVNKFWESVNIWQRYGQKLWLTFLGHPVHLYQGDKVFHPVRPSVPCLWFTQNRKAVETSNLSETWCRTWVTGSSHRFNDCNFRKTCCKCWHKCLISIIAWEYNLLSERTACLSGRLAVRLLVGFRRPIKVKAIVPNDLNDMAVWTD